MNLERLLRRSPAALDGYFALRGALKNGRLDPQLRARIAIVVSEANGCEYGLSRSIGEARKAGLDRDAIADARGGAPKMPVPEPFLRSSTGSCRGTARSRMQSWRA